MSSFFRKQIEAAIRETRSDNTDVIERMPIEAKTQAQIRLRALHGTPKQFAIACINAIGDISPLEAHQAIRKYLNEWNSAGNQKEI